MTVRMVSPATAAEAAAQLRASSRVAVDTEFHAENRYLPDLYLVQLGLDDGSALLVDPLVPGILDVVGPALRERPWVVHAGDHDLRILSHVLGGPPLCPVFDTQVAAGLAGPLYPAGYATLCESWLGVRVDKAETLSDWSRRPLSAAQLEYAARDVLHLFALADAVSARLHDSGRTEAATAACAEAVAAALDPGPDRALHELTANTNLEPRQAGVLRSLLQWREERARVQNQPPRVVAGDGILVDIARRLPRSAADLSVGRRFPKNVARWAPELTAVVEAALATDPSTWPAVVRRNTAAARRTTFLQLWAAAEGERRQWAAALVVPRELAGALALGGSLDPAGWRAAILGPAIHDAIAGRVGLYLSERDVEQLATGSDGGPQKNFINE